MIICYQFYLCAATAIALFVEVEIGILNSIVTIRNIFASAVSSLAKFKYPPLASVPVMFTKWTPVLENDCRLREPTLSPVILNFSLLS